MGKKKSHNLTKSTVSMTNPIYDSHTGSISTNWPPAVEPYYTTTITSSPANPAWLDKDFHEYVAMKDQFKKYKELLKEFQKYLVHKDAFEEYLEDYNSKIDVPTTLDF
jgi:ABC-type taurine transport system substrate-binding protein